MSSTDNTQPAPLMIVGEVASSGLARGPAMLCDCARTQTAVPLRQVSAAINDRFILNVLPRFPWQVDLTRFATMNR